MKYTTMIQSNPSFAGMWQQLPIGVPGAALEVLVRPVLDLPW